MLSANALARRGSVRARVCCLHRANACCCCRLRRHCSTGSEYVRCIHRVQQARSMHCRRAASAASSSCRSCASTSASRHRRHACRVQVRTTFVDTARSVAARRVRLCHTRKSSRATTIVVACRASCHDCACAARARYAFHCARHTRTLRHWSARLCVCTAACARAWWSVHCARHRRQCVCVTCASRCATTSATHVRA